jgi:hypothetical protein
MAGRFLLLSESLLLGPVAALSCGRSGAPVNRASLQGTPAVLWFWAPSRPFCNAEDRGVSQVAVAHPINDPLLVMPQQELSDRVVPLPA